MRLRAKFCISGTDWKGGLSPRKLSPGLSRAKRACGCDSFRISDTPAKNEHWHGTGKDRLQEKFCINGTAWQGGLALWELECSLSRTKGVCRRDSFRSSDAYVRGRLVAAKAESRLVMGKGGLAGAIPSASATLQQKRLAAAKKRTSAQHYEMCLQEKSCINETTWKGGLSPRKLSPGLPKAKRTCRCVPSASATLPQKTNTGIARAKSACRRNSASTAPFGKADCRCGS